MSAGFLLPWIILHQNGEILAAHCTCMAGYICLLQCLNYDVVNRLGEACSHIAAVTSCMINARKYSSGLVLIPVHLPYVAGVTLHEK